jgi:Cu(I)/Ag(I) efflux system membrane protein CusA/SilA
MLVYLNQALEQASKKTDLTSVQLFDLVLMTAARRVRPIVMTAITVVVGLIPVMISAGTGSEVMQRIAAPMVGGMLTSLALTLLVLPCVYYLWQSNGLNCASKKC